MKPVRGTGAGTASQYRHATVTLFPDHFPMTPGPPNYNTPMTNQGAGMRNGSDSAVGDGDDSPRPGNTRSLVNGWIGQNALWVFDKTPVAMVEAQFGSSNNAPPLFEKMPHGTTNHSNLFLG